MSDEKLTNSVQEDLMVILAFDDKNAAIIRNSVESELFEGIYRDIASTLYQFIDQFGETPKQAHLGTLFDTILEGKDTSKADLYTKTLANLIQMNDQGINTEYTLSRLNSFLRGQRLKHGILEAAEIVQDDSEESLDRAEHVLNKSMESSLDLFDPGVKFGDPEFLKFLQTDEEEAFPTGIPELDSKNLGPRRKELHMLLAPTKAGKSIWLTNLAVQAAMQRQRVLYISLEMSEAIAAQRFTQAMFSYSKRNNDFTHTFFEKDGLGNIVGFDQEHVTRKSMHDTGFRDWFMERMDEWGSRLGEYFMVKQFPTRQLTVEGLQSYLDSVERMHGFTPDLIILDYADLMNIREDSFRISLGRTIESVRGIGVERNVAMATVTQSNREGMESRVITETNLAEDVSKAFTVDALLTYSQTEAEAEMNLARLYVALSRNEEDGFSVMISQNYDLMQFCLDSSYMNSNYWDVLQRETVGDVTQEA